MDEERIRVLLVEDDPDDRFLVVDLLEEAAPDGYLVDGYGTFEEGWEALGRERYDVVLVDYRLGGRDGLDFLREAGESLAEESPPLIILTGQGSQVLDRRAMEEGAADYLPKEELSPAFLERAIRHAVHRAASARALERKAESQAAVARLGREALRREGRERFADLAAAVVVETLGVEGCGAYEREGEALLLRSWVGPEDRGLPERTSSEVLETLSPHSVPIPSPDGELGVLVVHPAPGREVSEEDLAFLHSVSQLIGSVAAQRRAEAEAQFRARLLDEVGQAVMATDLAGRVIYWNRAAEELYGWAREEALGAPVTELTPSPGARREAESIMEAMRRGKSWSGEFPVRRKDGSTFPAMVTNTPLLDEGGRQMGIVGISTDVTRRRSLEEQLRQAQKMDAVGRLAGGLAHDFNNILTVIRGQAQFLLESLDPGDSRRQDVVEIEGAAARAGSLTRQLLTFSRSRFMEVAPVSLDEVVAGMEGMLRRALGDHIRLEIRRDRDVPDILADVGSLEQVLLNLALNARDAMPQGGALRIEVVRPGTVERDDLSTERLKGSPELAALRVTDTGNGIPSEDRPYIFDPFFTTKKEGSGSGLGLAMIYGIVTQFRGEILVESVQGEGTSFTVIFPAGDEARDEVSGVELPAASPGESPATEAGGEVILLVDDDPAIRGLSQRILDSQGYTVLEAGGVEEAGRLARECAAPIHLLVTDVAMAEGGGARLAQELRERWPRLPVVFMSGYTEEEIRTNHGLPEEAFFLAKPFTPDLLRRRVREALDRRTPA